RQPGVSSSEFFSFSASSTACAAALPITSCKRRCSRVPSDQWQLRPSPEGLAVELENSISCRVSSRRLESLAVPWRPTMKLILAAALCLLPSPPLFAQGAPPQGAANKPYVMEYYYKVQWGHQQEFLNLFLKNHYPLLQERIKSGDLVSVKIET